MENKNSWRVSCWGHRQYIGRAGILPLLKIWLLWDTYYPVLPTVVLGECWLYFSKPGVPTDRLKIGSYESTDPNQWVCSGSWESAFLTNFQKWCWCPPGDHTLSSKVLADRVQNEWVSPCWQFRHLGWMILVVGDVLCTVGYLAASLSSAY